MLPKEENFQIRSQAVFNFYIRCIFLLNKSLMDKTTLQFVGADLTIVDRLCLALGVRNEADVSLFACAVEGDGASRNTARAFREDVLSTLGRFSASTVSRLVPPLSPNLHFANDDELFSARQVPWTANEKLAALITKFVGSDHDLALWKALEKGDPTAKRRVMHCASPKLIATAATTGTKALSGLRARWQSVRERFASKPEHPLSILNP